MVNQLKDYYTIRQVADFLGISRIAVYKKVKTDQIKAYRLGRLYCIPREEFASLSGVDLSKSQKKLLEQGIKKTVEEYGQALHQLGST